MLKKGCVPRTIILEFLVALSLPAIMFLSIILTGCDNSRRVDCNQVISDIYDNPRFQTKDTAVNPKIRDFLESNPNCIGLYFLFGDLLIDQDSLKSAEEIFMQSLKFSQANVYAYYKLGIISYINDKNDEAIEYFELALASKQKVGAYYFESQIGDHPEQFDVPVTELIFQTGLAFYYNNDLEKARSNFTHCIVQEYNLMESYFFMGAIMIEQNKVKEGCEFLRKANFMGDSRSIEYLRKYCN